MDALSRIGEFFWDDGRLTPEERQLAAQRYKERIRNKKRNEKQAAKKKKQPKTPKERKRETRGRSKQSRRNRRSAQRRRYESRNDSVSSSSASEGDYSDESMEDLRGRTFSSRSKSAASSDLTRESGTSRSSSISQLRTRTRSLQMKMGLRLGVRRAATASIKQDAEAGAGRADDESESETATGSISKDTNNRKRRVMDQLMEVISSDGDDDDSEISRSTSSSQDSRAHSSSHANSQGPSKYNLSRSRATNFSDNSSQLPVNVTAATSHGGFETGINDVSSTAARPDMEGDWQSMTTRSTKSKTLNGDWIEEYVDEDAAIELAIESSPSSEPDEDEPAEDEPAEEEHEGEDEDPVEEESAVPLDGNKLAPSSPSHPHSEENQAAHPPEMFARKPSMETMQTMDTRARRIKALFPPKFGKKISQLRPSLPVQLPKATAKSNIEPVLQSRDPLLMQGQAQSLQSSGRASDEKRSNKGKSKKEKPQQTPESKKEKPQQTPEDDTTDGENKAFSEAIAQMNKMGTSQDQTLVLKTPSSSSRSRSLPVQGSGAFKPMPPQKGEVSSQLSTTDLAENPTNSTTGTTGMKARNGSLLKLLSKQQSTVSKTGSQASKTVQHNKSNSITERVPSNLKTEVQETRDSGGPEKEAPQGMASEQGLTHTPDTSKDTPEVPPSSIDITGSGNSIPQNGTTEYSNSDDDDDLHEFIEVAYDPPEEEENQQSPLPSPLSALSRSFSRVTAEQSERPLSSPSPVGNIIMSNNLNGQETEPLEKKAQPAQEVASPQKKKSFFGSLFLRRKKKGKAEHQREDPLEGSNKIASVNLTVMRDASVEPSAEQLVSDDAKGNEHSTGNPLRKKWVRRSISFSRKKQEQSKSLEQNKEESDELARQATPSDIPSIQTRLPSILPLPPRMKAYSDGLTADIHAETPTVTNSILADADSSANDNPWGAIGHPSYLAPTESQQNTEQAGQAARPEDLSQMMTRKLLEEREPTQVEERGEIIPPDTQPVDMGRESNIARPDYQANPLKPKKRLSKFRGILRWHSKSTKRDQGPTEAKGLRDNMTDLGKKVAEEDDAKDDEIRTQPDDSVVAGGAGTTASSSKDETFLKQHQMMMQSTNPHWIHAQQQAPLGEDLPSSRQDTEVQTPAGQTVHETPDNGQTTLQRVLGEREKLKNAPEQPVNDTPEEEKGQTKLQRVLGEREKQKKAARFSTANCTLDARIPEEQLAQQLREILDNISSCSSFDSADGESNADETQDETQTSLCQETVDDSTIYSVQNQRVLDTLRLLHAVKRKKQLTEGHATKQKQSPAVRNCNAAVIEPLIDELEDYVGNFD